MTFKDLKRKVSLETTTKQRSKLFERLHNKPFWIWNIEDHKQEDIKTSVDCCFNHKSITKEAWNTAANTEDKREKIQALSLAKECYSMKLDLRTNATVVDDAIRFVSDKSKQNLKVSSSNSDEHQKESNEPEYNEDKDQLRENKKNRKLEK